METIKEILNQNKQVWFFIEENERSAFLKYAKENGCIWLNGNEINPDEDVCGFVMGIRQNLTMGFVPMFRLVNKEKQSPQIIKFKDILEVEYEENYNK